MQRIIDRPLPAPAKAKLAEYQAEVDGLATFAERVAAAKRLFSARNKSNNATFKAVRKTLDAMCSGARRCMYCEDSVADEVEHFRPKDFYPGLVFAWDNYLYVCGPCNGGKNNKFPLISALTGTIIHLTRLPGAPILEPDPGDPVLPNLRQEDPHNLLQLDLLGTFFFQPVVPDPTSLAHLRARQIIDILGLNARDFLPRARSEAYDSYRARLEQYVVRRDAGASNDELVRRQRSLQRMGHPTVWAEMKRQRHLIPILQELFKACPEALAW